MKLSRMRTIHIVKRKIDLKSTCEQFYITLCKEFHKIRYNYFLLLVTNFWLAKFVLIVPNKNLINYFSIKVGVRLIVDGCYV